MLDSLRRRFSPDRDPDQPADGRAPYALPRGVPALQQDADALRRRLLLGIAFASVLAGGTGFLAGRRGRAGRG